MFPFEVDRKDPADLLAAQRTTRKGAVCAGGQRRWKGKVDEEVRDADGADDLDEGSPDMLDQQP